MPEGEYWTEIERLKGKIEALGEMSEQEATQVLRDNEIDAVRRDAVINFRVEGFTEIRNEGFLIHSLINMQETIRIYRDLLVAAHADAPFPAKKASINVQIAASEHAAAKSETELVARRGESWREIVRAVLAEEIFRLRWEIAKEQHPQV